MKRATYRMNSIAITQGEFDKPFAVAKEYTFLAIHHDRRVLEPARQQCNILPLLHDIANVSRRRIFNISKPVADDRKYREPKDGARNKVSKLVLKHFSCVDLFVNPSLSNVVLSVSTGMDTGLRTPFQEKPQARIPGIDVIRGAPTKATDHEDGSIALSLRCVLRTLATGNHKTSSSSEDVDPSVAVRRQAMVLVAERIAQLRMKRVSSPPRTRLS